MQTFSNAKKPRKQLQGKVFVTLFLFIAVVLLIGPVGVFSQAEPITILPLGDSITEGDTVYNSYRRSLWFLLQNNGYNVDFIGSEINNYGGPAPNQDFDLDHEGHAGWRADQIVDRGLASWLENYTPDIVLLHIGSNDLTRVNRNNVVVIATLDDVREIIAVLRADNPDVIVFLAQLIPSCQSILAENIVAYNAELPALASEQTTAASPVIIVDQFTGFDANTDTHDCVHPNVSGEYKIANNWFNAIVSETNNTPALTATQTAVSPTSIPDSTATPTETPTITPTATVMTVPTSTPTNQPTNPPTATNTLAPTSTATETAVPGTCTGNTILFVGRTNPLQVVDQGLVNYLTAQGHTVIIRDERSVTSADSNEKNLVIVSDSVNSRRIGSLFTNSTVPFMTWEAGLYDDMNMTASSNADLGFVNGQTQLTITDNSHPMAAGLSGTVTALDSSDYFFFGHPSGNAVVIAEDTTGSHPVIFGYDHDAEMVGLVAPARRVGFFNGNSDIFAANGWLLFEGSVNWALGCN
jgi:lysophospholipase L1-like esterase